jgi:intergrase/recombinase
VTKKEKRKKFSAMMANLNGSSSSVEVVQMSNADNGQTTVTSSTSDELQKVNDFFEANASAIERWLKEKASDEVINRLNSITRSKNENREHAHRSSVTSELYQQWLSSSMKVSEGFYCKKSI